MWLSLLLVSASPPLLRGNSGEVDTAALVSLLGPHQRDSVILAPQQRPQRVQPALDWRVPLLLHGW